MEKHDKASSGHSETQGHLMRAAQKMGYSIEKKINKIKIRADEKNFLSIVFSDTFPDKFTDGEIVGFVDVSGFGDRLPDGQYGIKIYFDEKNWSKPSEFINVKSEEKYFFDTDTEKIEASSVNINASECSITEEECIWVDVSIPLPGGTIIHRTICVNCPDCYE
nr:hypothetical protein [uncultured Desulfobacter sp.]